MAYYFGMDPILLLVLLSLGFGALLAILFSTIKKEDLQRVSFNEALHSALATGFMGAIIGLVVALLFSIYPMLNFGLSALPGGFLFFLILVAAGFAIFFILGVVYFYVPIPVVIKHAFIGFLAGVAFGVLIWTAFVAQTGPFGEYAAFAMEPVREHVEDFFTEVGKFKYCLYADPKCPFFIQWDEPNVQNREEVLNIDLGFSDRRILGNEVNLLVSLGVKNPELTELKIKPYCYLGKSGYSGSGSITALERGLFSGEFSKDMELIEQHYMNKKKYKELEATNLGKYSEGDEFAFPLTNQELSTNFRCKGDVIGDENVDIEYVIIALRREVLVEANWPVYIGSEPNMGRSKTIMSYNAPYSIALVSDSDMPFEAGKEYDFSVVLKRLDEDSELEFIREIRLVFPDSMIAECHNFQANGNALELLNLPADLLKETSYYNDKEERYSMNCSLYVVDAPNNAVLSPIDVTAHYNVVSEYKTSVLKSPG